MGKPRICFTRHALDVMEEREIAREWVERESCVLRVVYNAEVDPVRVVTTFFDRGMRGKL